MSEKGLNPSQTFSYADEIISMFFLIAVKGLDKVFGTSLSFTITSNQLENGKEVLLNVEIQIRLKIAESYWWLKYHPLTLMHVFQVLNADILVEVGNDVEKIGF